MGAMDDAMLFDCGILTVVDCGLLVKIPEIFFVVVVEDCGEIDGFFGSTAEVS